MPASRSVTVSCWLPNLSLLAAGLVLAGGASLGGAYWVLGAFDWQTSLKLLAGLLGLGYWVTYCHVTVTPYEVRVLSSGLWKSYRRCPLEEAAIFDYWLLPEWAAQASYYSACLNLYPTDDWDTGIEYVEIEFYDEQQLNCFRAAQWPAISDALYGMAERRRTLEAALPPPADA